MSLGSTTAKNAVLAATIGDNRATAAGIPATLYLTFWNGDPLSGGTELTSTGGYGRVGIALTSSVWNTPSLGSITTNTAVTTSVSTAAYSAAITHVALADSATIGGGNLWDTGALGSTVTVSAANQVVRFAAGALTITQA